MITGSRIRTTFLRSYAVVAYKNTLDSRGGAESTPAYRADHVVSSLNHNGWDMAAVEEAVLLTD